MRVAILVGGFPPKKLAGTEIATYYLAISLAKRGHEIHIITSRDDDLPALSEESGFHIYRVPYHSKIRIIGILPFWVWMYLQIRKIDPVVVHSQSIPYGIPALLAKKSLKIPYVVWGQGSDVYLPGKLLSLISKPILLNANAVLALTEDMKQAMQRICDKEVSVVPNGIDLRKFKPSSEWGNDGNTKTILFVGRLHPVKGVQYLVEAMTIVHQEMPDAKLILVGDGEEGGHLKSLADHLSLRECIEFAGRVPNERVQGYMSRADIFVLPSLSEGFPVTVLEAMACGLPIVATRVRGMPNIIKEGKNGYLVEAMEPRQIAEALLKLLHDDQMRNDMSNNNRKTAEGYAWDTIAATVEGIYQDVLGSPE